MKKRSSTFTPDDSQYWDSPSTVVSYMRMFAVSGSRRAITDHAKVEMLRIQGRNVVY
jgi:hypothetical protein